MKFLFIAASTLALTLFGQAAPVEKPIALALSVRNQKLIIGERLAVEVDVKNQSQSDQRITFAWAAHGGPPDLFIERSGKKIYCQPTAGRGRTANFNIDTPLDQPIMMPPGGVIHFSYETDMGTGTDNSAAGDYEASVSLEGKGKVDINRVPGDPPQFYCEGCWEGLAVSNRVTVHLEQVKSEDGKPSNFGSAGMASTAHLRNMQYYWINTPILFFPPM